MQFLSNFRWPTITPCGLTYSTIDENKSISVDGSFDDWSDVDNTIFDPTFDSDAQDLEHLSVAKNESGLFLHIKLRDGHEASSLRINFKSLAEQQDHSITSSSPYNFVFEQGQLLQSIDDQLVVIPSINYQLVKNGSHLEIFLSRYLIGEITSWPVWGVTVSSTHQGVVLDQLGPAIYQSLIYPNNNNLTVQRCTQNIGEFPYTLFFLHTSNIPQLEVDVLSSSMWHVITALTPLHSRAKTLGTFSTLASGFSLNDQFFDLYQPKSDYLSSISKDYFNSEHLIFGGLLHVTSRYLNEHTTNTHDAIKEIFAHAMAYSYLAKHAGHHYWLARFKQVMMPNSNDPLLLSFVLSHSISATDLFEHWVASRNFAELVSSISTQSISAQISDWITDSMTELQLGNGTLSDVGLLQDSDQDQLPNFFEIVNQTDTNVADSDQDGWPDFAEFVLNSGSNSRPDLIMQDGNINDWFRMLPQAFRADSNLLSKECKGGDILKSLSLFNNESIGIAAELQKDGEPVNWEVFIQMPYKNKSWLISTTSNSNKVVVYNIKSKRRIIKSIPLPYTINPNQLELMISINALNLDTMFSKNDKLIAKLRTTSIDGSYVCDDTPWVTVLNAK
jgi:hypothetical protein